MERRCVLCANGAVCVCVCVCVRTCVSCVLGQSPEMSWMLCNVWSKSLARRPRNQTGPAGLSSLGSGSILLLSDGTFAVVQIVWHDSDEPARGTRRRARQTHRVHTVDT